MVDQKGSIDKSQATMMKVVINGKVTTRLAEIRVSV